MDFRSILDPNSGYGIVIVSLNRFVELGSTIRPPRHDGRTSYPITVVEGSEEFISVGITLTTKNTTTVPHIITETPMTNAAMTIISISITFATSTITIGANTGAAKVDSHLPPSFPSPIFPPSLPQMPKLALAANPRPQLSFPPPPMRGQATAGINCRRAANTDGAKRHLTGRGFYIPVIPAPAYAGAGYGGNPTAPLARS